MGLFNLFRKKAAPEPAQSPSYRPYSDESANFIYNLLFCDDTSLLIQAPDEPRSYPFDILLAEPARVAELQQLAADRAMEPRVKALAWHRLRAAGQMPQHRELFAVIVEVGLEEGLDVLGTFADSTARYINQSGKLIIWENTDDAAAKGFTAALFNASLDVLDRIGPWEKPRLAPPPAGTTRISFLVSDGLYFGQGPSDQFFNDPLAQPALMAATQLMRHLTEKSLENQ